MRFRKAQHLVATLPAIGDTTSSAFSVWLKASQFTSQDFSVLLSQYGVSGGWQQLLAFNYGSTAPSTPYVAFSSTLMRDLSKVFRDPAGWYHLMLVTNADGFTLYVNGKEVWFNTVRKNFAFLRAVDTYIGAVNTASNNDAQRFEGYLAELHYVDGGGALLPSDFAQYGDERVWLPKTFEGSHGAAGFYLDFSDAADIGADRSGNNNNFTPVGFELADQTSYEWDHMADTPTLNFCNYNTAQKLTDDRYMDIEDAGLAFRHYQLASANPAVFSTFGIRTGKWYWESTYKSGGPAAATGIGDDEVVNIDSTPYNPGGAVIYQNNGRIYSALASSGQNVGFSKLANGACVGVALDIDAKKCWWSVDGNWGSLGGASDPSTGANPHINAGAFDDWSMLTPIVGMMSTSSYGNICSNYGQRPFKYTPPTDFKELKSANFPECSVTKGTDGCRVILDSGANIFNSARGLQNTATNYDPTITTGFPTGLWLIKDTAAAGSYSWVDSVRGVTGNCAILGQAAVANPNPYTAPANTSVAYCFSTDGNAATANNDGSIQSTVSASDKYGFSVITYDGTGANGSVGHGLSKRPEFFICKKYSGPAGGGASNFIVWCPKLADAAHVLYLDTPGQVQFSYPTCFNSNPIIDDTTIQLGTAGPTNAAGSSYVIYAWYTIPGYSALKTYKGNQVVDGPFVDLGFRPALVMNKSINSANGDWVFKDSTQAANNPHGNGMYPQYTPGLITTSQATMDFVSNGIKIRTNDALVNHSIGDYITMAWAENPFVGSNVMPANAR